jgi:ABC-type antimicrobial peptide transport system permease subunit
LVDQLMPLLYPVRRIFRSWKLFIALLVGISLASAFFAGIDVKANLTARQTLDSQLAGIITDMEFTAQLNSTNLAQALPDISKIDGVTHAEILSRTYAPVAWINKTTASVNQTTINETTIVPIGYFQFAGLPSSSRVYDGWSNKPAEELGENETYILKGSWSALGENIGVGDEIQTSLTFYAPKLANSTTLDLNLTVRGFAELSDEAYSVASGQTFYVVPFSPTIPGQQFNYKQDLLIISYNNTIQKLWNTMPETSFDTNFLVSLDRDRLINPWDSQTSSNNLQRVSDNIQNTILANFEGHVNVQNNLQYALQTFTYQFSSIYMSFILVSLPVFFVAWYIGYTVSDVSFNLRRREIGLLSTKGLSSGQIQRMFFAEALLIGLAGGVIGLFGGLLLNQVFTGFDLKTLLNPQLLNPYTMVLTVAFGVVLSFLSVFFSARKASRMSTVDALKEYTSVETDKPYRKRLVWVAFILGTYKIIVFILGINMSSLINSASFLQYNFIITLFLLVFSALDNVLNYVGPLLFFWGLTKLLIQNSLTFQQITSKASRLGGDLGALAAKNVRRSPARSAAIAFLVALIIGYSVQVGGQLASEQDFAVRQVQANVEANVAVSVVNATKAELILNDIMGNVSGIQNATMECTLIQYYAGTQIKTIDPDSWLSTAYYEKQWFSGANFEDAFNQLRTNNQTIILERRVAQELKVGVGDEIGIDFPSGPRKLKIVALFGPEAAESGIITPMYTVQTWSYVPRNLFNMSSPFSDAYMAEAFNVEILLKLAQNVNGTQVAESIRNLDLEVYGVESFDEQWALTQANPYGSNSLQLLDVQRLGVIFAVLAASVGTALISVVSMRERSREATLMSVRGLSYKQLVWMFLTENLAVITFAVALGLIVGFIIVYGNIASANAAISELVKRQFVFPSDALITVGSCVSLIFASTILPIIIMSRQYVTKLERMIRLR